jgi:ribosomal protein RSM22 (predicted rRNA methylase)
MKDRIDPGLLEHLDRLEDHETGDVVVMFNINDDPAADAETTAQAMLDRASGTTGAAAASVRILPRLGAMYVTGSSEFLKKLLADEQIYAASRGDL